MFLHSWVIIGASSLQLINKRNNLLEVGKSCVNQQNERKLTIILDFLQSNADQNNHKSETESFITKYIFSCCRAVFLLDHYCFSSQNRDRFIYENNCWIQKGPINILFNSCLSCVIFVPVWSQSVLIVPNESNMLSLGPHEFRLLRTSPVWSYLVLILPHWS